MKDRVAIVAMAQTRFEKDKAKERVQEMGWEVVKKVRQETGLDYHKPGHIEFAVTCSDDFYDARTISDAPIGDIVGAQFEAEEKVNQDSLQAIFYAMATILSGHAEISIVLTHCKESQAASRNMISYEAFDPIFSRGVGLDYLVAAGLQAQAYMARTGATPAQCAAAVVRDRKNAAKNPVAQEKAQVSVQDVLNSPLVCDPLRELDIYPQSDGAVAMIMATEKRAKELCKKPIFIEGAGNCYDAYFLGDRDISDSPALRLAAERAYAMAGIKNIRGSVQMAEVSARYSYQELMWLEGLGLCQDREAGKWIESGATDLGGEFPVNTSGGMIAGNPILVSGMARAAECVLQLRGEAGGRQVKGVKKALAHGTTGPAGQHHCVMIFSAE